MGYDVDEKKLRQAMEGTCENQELYDKALKKGWSPDFQKAIEEWHNACYDPEVGLGYAEHIIEEHSEKDILVHIEPPLLEQALDFLAELGE